MHALIDNLDHSLRSIDGFNSVKLLSIVLSISQDLSLTKRAIERALVNLQNKGRIGLKNEKIESNLQMKIYEIRFYTFL